MNLAFLSFRCLILSTGNSTVIFKLTDKINLTLFVRSGESGTALSQLYKALEHHAFNDYELTIIDVNEDPMAASLLGISNTPALLKHLERGNIHYAGDFTDFERMRLIFGFKVISSNVHH